MEGILRLKQELRKIRKLVNSLYQMVQNFGTIGVGGGPPGEEDTGRWFWDVANEQLYFNPVPGDSTTWKLIS